jgi:hypothetical protein
MNRPGALPLSPGQQELLEQAHRQLHERMLHGGLTSSDVNHIVTALRDHPAMGTEVLQILREEVRQLPLGHGLINFDWD